MEQDRVLASGLTGQAFVRPIRSYSSNRLRLITGLQSRLPGLPRLLLVLQYDFLGFPLPSSGDDLSCGQSRR